jgi:Endosomal/lysosomal potassium channel TMEM175
MDLDRAGPGRIGRNLRLSLSWASMKKEKLDAFTDAVVAIIITLMVLEIKLLKVNSGNLWKITGVSFIFKPDWPPNKLVTLSN